MYEKIKLQDTITNFLIDGDFSQIEYKPVSSKPLEEILDQENIHGFLQEKIDIVESRLAQTLALCKNPSDKLFELGQECGKDKDFSNFEEISTDLNKYLLEGMPCDQGLSAVPDGGSLYLITNNNLHKKYKDDINLENSRNASCQGGHDHDHHESFEVGAGVVNDLKTEESDYHKYRLDFLRGYFSQSPYEVDLVNGINYKITKK